MPEPSRRIAYIDWLRGFACLVMFQTHCYDSWLGGKAREGGFIKLSQLGGTLPAPLFLFLAGVSFAMVTDKLRQKGVSANEIARTTILRGGEIFCLALLFRLQEFLLGQPFSPWTDLLRVDILNVIGISLIMMGIACRIAAVGTPGSGTGQEAMEWPMYAPRLRKITIVTAVACAAAIAIVTPQMWTTWRPHWHMWWLESYIDGVHTFAQPQPWMFPIFPWAAFAFAGLAIGSLLLSEWARRNQTASLAVAGAAGVALFELGLWLDVRPVQLYTVHDFWHTSPNFFLVRLGLLLVTTFAGYAWCKWGPGERGFSPLIEMGKCSLLVYWVHIEFVYGGLSIVPRRSVGVGTATLGLVAIFCAMTLLAVARNRFPDRKEEIMAYFRRAAST
ncbi:MAG: heparan-alpha-glucosaminide N-acetyltransferase domain-containing protein [Candidatus Acidiferrales bacterium]|jgi:uncharacterized membrane protein